MFAGVLPHDRHFYPRSPCGERPSQFEPPIKTHGHFYPRSPCGERQSASYNEYLAKSISIHALLAESDVVVVVVLYIVGNFYPRSPCGERPAAGRFRYLDNIISIHALLAESDRLGLLGWLRTLISIHALLAESDRLLMFFWPFGPLFLSTLSLRRATTTIPDFRGYIRNFYPRSPCGERLRREMSLMRP